MRKPSKKSSALHVVRTPSLGEMIHDAVRATIEKVVEEELASVLGVDPYERAQSRRGYRNGHRQRTLTGPTGPAELRIPRGVIETPDGKEEWSSQVLPRYSRRMPEINEAILGSYLAGHNSRRIRGALRPLLKDAPLSKSAISRVVGTLKASFHEWRVRPLKTVEVAYIYLDAFALKVRRDGRVASAPVLTAIAVFRDGQKQLLSLELCTQESTAAWKGFIEDLDARGLPSPFLCIIDGNPGLSHAVQSVWPAAKIQRCTVHKLRNIERKAPKQSYEELKDDYHAIIYARSRAAADDAWRAFERKWSKRCAAVVASLNEGGCHLLTFFDFPEEQWKTIRSTNVIERLNEEFRRRVKTQASIPCDDAAEILLFGLVASGQIKLRRIDGYQQMPETLRHETDHSLAA